MSRIDLPDVTLCCVDTRSVPQALYAIRRCMSAARFGQAIYFGPAHKGFAHIEGLSWVPIEPLTDIEAYNRFVLLNLLPHITTSHVLVVQWDGFITHAHHWQDDFMNWDFIGAPWVYRKRPSAVGNGGFSLRSRRLLQALSSIDLDTSRPEDAEICTYRRQQLEQEFGIRIAPIEVAERFSREYGPYQPAFGFHGLHNFAHVMDTSELNRWIETAPCGLLTGQHGRKLVKSLLQEDREREAIELVRRRSQTLGWTLDQCLLYLRAHVHRLRPLIR